MRYFGQIWVFGFSYLPSLRGCKSAECDLERLKQKLSYKALYLLHFEKKMCPFKFCKIGLKNTFFIFGRKMVVCCLLLLFVATFSDFG